MDERALDRLEVIKRLFDITYQALEQQLKYHSTTSRASRAKDLFGKLPFFLSSFVNIVENRFLDNMPDENTLASITRNIIELRNVFQYVNEYKLTKDEINFRAFSMDLHRASREIKILKTLGTQDENIEIRWNFMLSLVEETNFYKSLSEKDKKRVSEAYKPYYWEFMKHRRHVINREIEVGLYDLLSNLVHSYPLSTSIRFEMPYGLLFQYEKMIILCCEATIIYSASIIWDYISLRSTVFRDIIQIEKKFLKNCLDTKQFLQFINENKIRRGGIFGKLPDDL